MLSMAFRRACRPARVADFRFQHLRHHTASWLAMKEVNQPTIESTCGWKGPRDGQGRCQRPSVAAIQDAVRLLIREQEARPLQPDSHYSDTRLAGGNGQGTELFGIIGVPNGIRTRVSALKGPRPGPD